MATQPARKGLSLLTNQSDRGRLIRQIGKSNLLSEKATQKINVSVKPETRVVLQQIPVAKTEKVPEFEVYCDPEDQCSSSVPQSTQIEEKENNTHQRLRGCSDSECSSSAPVSSIAGTFRSAFSDICVEDSEDGQSSLYGSALDYETDYETAISTRDEHEDLIICHPQFSHDIYRYMRQKEAHHRVKKNFLEKQNELNSDMRSILVDWINDVIVDFNLERETLHLAVSLVDRTLTRFRVERAKLQLVGATALMIASKYEEIYPPELKDFVHITDNTYQDKQLLLMERTILGELQFEVSVPTAQWFATRFAKLQKASSRTTHAMNYLVDMMLLEVDYTSLRPSFVASAALCYANVLTGPAPWSSEMERATGISIDDMTRLLGRMHELFRIAPESKFQSIYQKYCSESFDCVSALSPPSSLPL